MGYDFSTTGEPRKRRLTCNLFKDSIEELKDLICKVTAPDSEKQVEETIMMRKVFHSMDIKRYLSVKFTQAEMFEFTKSIRYCFRKKGDKVCTAGEKDNRLYFILRGKVRMSLPKTTIDGKTKKPGWAHA